MNPSILRGLILAGIICGAACAAPPPVAFVNSLGQNMVRIEPGAFMMGSRSGDRDEEPLHMVGISQPFHLSATEVTNKHYEEFDPAHRRLRGKHGFSTGDDEAVVYVSWDEARAFCAWLSAKEGRPYRLPTEAEWEYACRAGTSTEFNTGEELPAEYQNSQALSWYPDPARSQEQRKLVRPLVVGRTPPNVWGLHDMHGNVEEWCLDWYGPYVAGDQDDPVGREDGEFRVTRGGSHSTEVRYLRSANRSGTIPEDKSWITGFRVAMGPMPVNRPLPVVPPELYQQKVSQVPVIPVALDPSVPFFRGPRVYVKVTPTPRGPFFPHNHVPSLAELPNGDLLAIWYTTIREVGRELHYIASRLRLGATEWEPASESFFSPPDRNAHAGILWWDRESTLWHINGLGVSATWGALSLLARTSKDNGVTWTKPRFIDPEHAGRHMPIASIIQTESGAIAFTTDVPGIMKPAGDGGSALWVSTDGGETFHDAGVGQPAPVFASGQTGAWIAGIHAPIAETADRRGIVSFGRRDKVKAPLLRSVTYDLGKTWTYSASTVEEIGSGQRPSLLRLQDGSLFLASFTKGMELTDAVGVRRTVRGLYVALSDDDGVTWKHRRLVTDDKPPRKYDGGAWTKEFELGPETAEPKGYITSIQARNGIIHLISSALHYEFNPAWIREPMPAAQLPAR
jgi:formylglycine-generating enzyme required for sulfatase activity